MTSEITSIGFVVGIINLAVATISSNSGERGSPETKKPGWQPGSKVSCCSDTV